MPTTMTWCDKQGHRDRKSWLLLVKEDEVKAFQGSSIPGIVAVLGEDYEKRGKWSNTTYRLALASGVTAVAGRDGWERGTFVEGLSSTVGKPVDRWTDLAQALGVTIDSAKRFLAAWRPLAAEALDKVETDLASLL